MAIEPNRALSHALDTMPNRPSPIDVRKIAQQQIKDASPGRVLRDALTVQGMSVNDAAARLKTSPSTLSLMLADKRPISKAMAIRIEQSFGVPGYVIARLRFESDFQSEQEQHSQTPTEG